jgi:hypothetical protein
MQATLERKPNEPVVMLNYDEVLELIGGLDVKFDAPPPGHRIILAREAREARRYSRTLLRDIKRFKWETIWMM